MSEPVAAAHAPASETSVIPDGGDKPRYDAVLGNSGAHRNSTAADADDADDAAPTDAANDAPAHAGAKDAVPGDEVPGDAGADRAAVDDEAPIVAEADIPGALEAILLVVDSPVSEAALAAAIGRPAADVQAHLLRLSERLTEAHSGMDLRDAGGGWRLYTRDDFAPVVERFVLDGTQSRLSKAALESLAVVAYRQPVTRARIAAVRGVNVDGVVRTLVSRGLIEEDGIDPDTGGFLYRTTEMFLERMGLASIEDLPQLGPLLPDVDAIDDE